MLIYRLYNFRDTHLLEGGFMQKKKALGMDPLSWLKGKNEEEKPGDDISNQEKQIDNPSETKNDDDDNELNIEHKIQEEDRENWRDKPPTCIQK